MAAPRVHPAGEEASWCKLCPNSSCLLLLSALGGETLWWGGRGERGLRLYSGLHRKACDNIRIKKIKEGPITLKSLKSTVSDQMGKSKYRTWLPTPAWCGTHACFPWEYRVPLGGTSQQQRPFTDICPGTQLGSDSDTPDPPLPLLGLWG